MREFTGLFELTLASLGLWSLELQQIRVNQNVEFKKDNAFELTLIMQPSCHSTSPGRTVELKGNTQFSSH